MLDTLNIILIVVAVILGVLYFSIRGARKNRERRMASKR
jgi:hypothetical protein